MAKTIGFLGKKSFSSFVDYRCDRKLYIDLGNHDSRWVRRDIQIRSGKSDITKETLRLGREYEQEVYQRLFAHFPTSVYAKKIHSSVVKTELDMDVLREIHANVHTTNHPQIGLELEFDMPDAFVHSIFDSDEAEGFPTQGNDNARRNRPDILIFGRPAQHTNEEYELLCDGTIQLIAPNDTRVGISILDIKNSQHDRIGLRHFSELIFYAYALRFFLDKLEKEGLPSLFYVRVSGHSIFGRRDLDSLTSDIQCLMWEYGQDLDAKESSLMVAPMVWEDTHELFLRFRTKVQQLWRSSKESCDVDQIAVRVQKKCARCPFVDDCSRLLAKGTPDPSKGNVREWDIRLLPLLKMDVAQQIIDFGIQHKLPSLQTMGNVHDNLSKIKSKLGDVPTPLHAEINTLKMRLEALLHNKMMVADDKYFSKYLPNQINMALIFNLEKEDLNDIVFAYSLKFSVIAPFHFVNKNLRSRHYAWWNAWIDIMTQGREPDWKSIRSLLDMDLLFFHNFYYHGQEKFEQLPEEQQDERKQEFNDIVVGQLQSFHKSLSFLHDTGQLTLKRNGIVRSNDRNIKNAEPLVSLNINHISDGFEAENEYSVVVDLINVLYHVLNICITTETLTPSWKHTQNDEKKIVCESFAGFYWSQRQVEALRELMERHLVRIRSGRETKQETYHQFTQILRWFAPSESGVLSYKFFEKMYDIELFMKHAVAFPKIIAYSWHELIQIWEPSFTADHRYWIPHYNFIDFTSWYDVLNAENNRTMVKAIGDLSKQLHIKMQALDTILFELYQKSKAARILPPESVTISSSSFLDDRTDYFNSIARTWYSYSKLNGMVSEVEAGVYRNTWTDYSIAKLRAGSVAAFSIEEGEEIANLDQKVEQDERYDYEPTTLVLLLKDISRNMKIKNGDRVQLLHEDMRDSHAKWLIHQNTSQFNVTDVVWDKAQQGYLVKGFINIERMYSQHMERKQFPALNSYQVWKTLHERDDLPEPSIFSLLVRTRKQGWHLHHQESDIWSQRLYSILQRQHLGSSWLGDMLALENDLHQSDHVRLSSKERSTLREVYLYRPSMLSRSQWDMDGPLRTKIKFAPDPSQKQAIKNALSNVASCIQGPPGTGKSQTIIALLDEFILRFQEKYGRNPKILISAFSYAALEVLLHKLYESREGDGAEPDENRPSQIAQMPTIFASSKGREIHPPEEIHPDQHPLISFQRNGAGWWVNDEKINRRKWSRAPKKLYLMGHVFHMTCSPIEEEPTIDPKRADGKNKTKKEQKKERDALLIAQLHRNDELGFVMFANAHFLYNFGKPQKRNDSFAVLQEDFGFDLVVIDEASQMPADHFSSISRLVHNRSVDICIDPIFERVAQNDVGESIAESCAQKESTLAFESAPDATQLTQVVLVGDHNQLPPIQQIKPSERLRPFVGSVFEYFMETHGVHNSPLEVNYRSHQDIVDCIRSLGLYDKLTSFRGVNWAPHIQPEALKDIEEPWLKHVLDPSHAVLSILHDSQYDTALSVLEAEITAKIVIQLYKTLAPRSPKEELSFWQEEVGIVAPHNAHANIISRNILLGLGDVSLLGQTKLKECLDTTIYSVEKFQGSDRSIIIGSMGVSSTEQLQAEEEFLYNMNRFNVLISRAKHKMILICSYNYLQYVPQKSELMKVARNVRAFANEICQHPKQHRIEVAGGQLPITIRIKK